jgi:hypothetical protein
VPIGAVVITTPGVALYLPTQRQDNDYGGKDRR